MKMLNKSAWYLLCILLLQYSNVNAQSKSSLLFGPELNFKGNVPTTFLKGKNGNIFGIDNSVLPDGWFYKINTNMELVGQANLPLAGSEKLYKVISFNNEIYFVTLEEKDKKRIFSARKLDQDKFLTDSKKIYESDYSSDKDRKGSIIEFVTSEDNKTLVISERYNTGNEDALNQFAVALDESLTAIWKRDISVTGYARDFVNYVDSSGNFYFHKGRMRAAIVDIYKTGKNIESFIRLILTSEGRKIQNVRIKEFNEGEILTTGFCSSDCEIRPDKEGGGTFCSRGTFSIILDDETGETISADYKNFGKEILQPSLTAKEKEDPSNWWHGKGGGSRNAFDVMNVIGDMNGFIVIGEYQDAGTSGLSIFDIAVMAIDTEGKLVWHSVIPRRSSFSKSKTFGVPNYFFCYETSNGRYDIYFNDHKDNLDTARVAAKGITWLEKINNDTRLLKVSLDADGNTSEKNIAFKNVENENILFFPTCSATINTKESVILAQVKGKFKLGRVTY